MLVVHGRRSFLDGPAAATFGRVAADVRFHGGVRPNPTIDEVREGVALARGYRPDTVVGVGGGSAMDVAKCVAVLAGCDGEPLAYLLGSAAPPLRRTCRLVLVPTLAGSGSEMTGFATVYVDDRKLSLDHASARADHVVIDPDLAATVPTQTAAASALDAFAQAVESAWAVAATARSRELAVQALETLAPVLGTATGRGTFADAEVRTGLARGAALAGAAIAVSRTTAAHALSYTLTARFGIVHGAAVGLHLRWLIAHNQQATAADTRHPDGPDAVRRVIDRLHQICVDGAGVPLETMIDRLLELHGAVGFPDGYEPTADDLSGGRASNNPRFVHGEDVLRATRQAARSASPTPESRSAQGHP